MDSVPYGTNCMLHPDALLTLLQPMLLLLHRAGCKACAQACMQPCAVRLSVGCELQCTLNNKFSGPHVRLCSSPAPPPTWQQCICHGLAILNERCEVAAVECKLTLLQSVAGGEGLALCSFALPDTLPHGCIKRAAGLPGI